MTAASDFVSYIEKLIYSWMRTLILLGSILVPCFLILDHIVIPNELFSQFLIYRFISTALLVIQYAVLRFTKPGKFSFSMGISQQ